MNMEDFDFTENEIKDQLKQLGYTNVSNDRLRDFKRDLESLVRHEKSKNSSWSTVSDGAQSRDTANHIYVYRPQTTPQPDFSTLNYHQQHCSTKPSTAPGQAHLKSVPQMPRPTEAFTDARISQPSTSRGAPAFSERSRGMSPGYADDSALADTSLNTTGSTERRIMKRKVLRKVDGKSHVFDESSVTESDFTDDISEVEERLRDLPLPLNEMERPKTAPSGERRRIYGLIPPDRPHTARVSCEQETPQPFGVPDDHYGPKALIKPMTSHPHMRNVKKTDVVNRHQQYRNSWFSQKAPGEKKRDALRWNVREQLLYHDEVVEKKQHRVFVPNKYKIPTDKKRKNLRWQMRQDLAQGVVPPSIFE